ncbi:RNA polymerase sigma factor [Paenibacillus bouchesdurhonensis]|uniref:RNA polymerase sigma factor n=1 Tax=Paenibacillus bouchesdurhonensis TaxID=1870990 RepID=UPI000DA62F95|nr:sigma-70 family RNA polymerase sigma factor [Paenibacillus bouchesdurhonensis]
MSERLKWLLVADFNDLAENVQEEIYYAFYDLVYGSVYYIVKDHQTTEDIIQEAFMKVVDHKPSFDGEAGMKSWLKVVTRNTAINFLRKSKKYRNHLDTDSVYIEIDPFINPSGSVEQMVETKLMEEAIVDYLQKLKPEYRLLVEYRWKLGLSYREIAERLNVSEDVVRQRLHRTREGIKKMLFKEWGDHIETKQSPRSRISRGV